MKYGAIRSAAADWSRYPLGTKFRMVGQPHVYVIDDYGSALVGTDTIDIYKPNLTMMKEWGVREIDIEILECTTTGPGRPSIAVTEKAYGTVSSTLISLGVKPRDAIYQYSNGSPDESKFEDYSPLLRDILSRGLRESRTKAEV